MPTTTSVVHDPSRVAGLRRLALMDTPAEEAFDRLTRTATRVLHAPIALISIMDGDRQFFKSCIGLPEPWASRRETPLSHSFCQHAVETREPLVIEDAREHPLVRENLAIRDLGVIAYAGVPLLTSEGLEVGTFCVIDTEPRHWTADDLALLHDLAACVVTLIEFRAASLYEEDGAETLGALYDRYGQVMYELAYAVTRNEADAEEAVIEGVCRAVRSEAPCRSIRARIARLTRSCALERARRSRAAAHALDGLPEEERCAIELAYFARLSVEEIAEELGAPIGVVRKRMSAGLSRLRASLPQIDCQNRYSTPS